MAFAALRRFADQLLEPTPTQLHYGVHCAAMAFISLLDLSTAVAQPSLSMPTHAYFLNSDASMLEAYLLQCEVAGKSEDLKCKVMDIAVSPDISEANAVEKRRHADVEAQNLIADKSGLAQMCSVQPKLNEALVGRPEALAARLQTALADLCATKSLAAAKKLVLSMVEHGQRTCVIGSGGGWETVFSKRGPNTWVANNGPDGICGRITIETLEKDPSKPLTWCYTIRKATTAPGHAPICAKFPDATLKYEWSVNERPVTCEAIKFGLPRS